MFAGDWFLGAHAGNYFAKSLLLSQPAHRSLAEQVGVDSSRLCLLFWHTKRRVALEDMPHAVWDCPLYSCVREDFVLNIPFELGAMPCASAYKSHQIDDDSGVVQPGCVGEVPQIRVPVTTSEA